jgi:hypothetical protein
VNYQKPELVEHESALKAIQTMAKPHGSVEILDPSNPLPSQAAYEADE